jgi:ABC-type multidrug transport system fused ATPase/permease subunit
MTAHDNIAIGDISRIGNQNQEVQDAVIFAAKKSNIHNTIISLPKGYQTVLSRWLVNDEEGIDLSGGEWQKIALARMFMRNNADLFILDEPTAALDPQAELEIFSRFIKTSRGKTTILVSHRFSTVAIAEVIAVIEEGRIIEYGSHKQLLKKGGVYAKLYNIQAKQFRELESYEL